VIAATPHVVVPRFAVGSNGSGGPCVERFKSSTLEDASGNRPRRVAALPPVYDLAVSHTALAVLTRGTIHLGSKTISVPQDVTHISLSGRHVAYASGRSVYVDGRVVARRTVQPIGVSISGRRVVWAERSRGRSIIYSLG
jgi:hypothetical protein